MKKRSRIPSRKSKKSFTKYANKVHPKNQKRVIHRGGERLT